MPLPALVVHLDSRLSLVTNLLGESGADLGWAEDKAVCECLKWGLIARRILMYPEGGPEQVGVEARWRPEAPAVPRADPAPAAATAEEVAARVAKEQEEEQGAKWATPAQARGYELWGG